jgi:phage gp29-like protein
MAAERIGVPSILAIFEAKNDTEAQGRAKVLSNLMAELGSGSSGAIGNVKDIKVVESTISDFNVIVDTCNAEIAYGLTGQTLTTNQAEFGTKAQGVLHDETFKTTVFSDAYLLQETDQKLVDWFVEINFPGEVAPSYDIDSTDYADWATVREAIDRGVPVSLSALYEKTHIPKPKDASDSFLKPASVGNVPAGFSDQSSRHDFFFRTQRTRS